MKLTKREVDHHPKKWGGEDWIVNNSSYCGKILRLNPESKFSMHFHDLKEETFYVLSGWGILRAINTENSQEYEIHLSAGDVVDITRLTPHQIIASKEGITIIEFSTQHFESDSYRVRKGDSQDE